MAVLIDGHEKPPVGAECTCLSCTERLRQLAPKATRYPPATMMRPA